MKKKINVAIIGLGVGERHLQTLIKSKNVNKIKIYDLNKLKEKKISKQYNVECYKTSADIFSDNKIDLVIDASYDNYHFDHIKFSIKSKKHIFVEKPAFQKLSQAKICFQLLKKNNKIFFGTNFILRTSPRFKKIKKMIKNNKFGDIFHFEGDYNYGRLEKLTNGWRGKIPYYSITSGGGSHIIDLANYFINKKIIEVKSYSNNIVTKKSSFKYDDNVISILKFENNILGKISSNFSCVYPHFHKLTLYGTKLTFENYKSHGQIYIKRNDEKNFKIKDPYKPVNKGEVLEKFINSIIKKKNRDVYLKQVFNVMSVCFAIERSTKINRSVKVKYLK